MRVLLIHNPSAGESGPSCADELVSMIRDAGHEVAYYSSKKKEEWHEALESASDLVAVAGGDGTVARVGRRLEGRNIPLAILPSGSANNMALTLGLTKTPLRQLVAGWSQGRQVSFDMGFAIAAWGEKCFLESLGAGLFAWAMPRFTIAALTNDDPDSAPPEKELRAARLFMRKHLKRFRPRSFQVSLDGQDLSGDFLLLEAMNTRTIGPNLTFAPEADTNDGLLDVVVVRPEDRDKLKTHFRQRQSSSQKPENLTVYRGKQLIIQGTRPEFHLDDRPWPGKQDAQPPTSFSIDVEVHPKALTFLIPDTNSD